MTAAPRRVGHTWQMPPSSVEIVQIHGRKLAIRTGGQGGAVVLIHGLAGDSQTWDKVLPSMSEESLVVAPDLPGHGMSDGGTGDCSLGSYASTIRDLLLSIGIERATLVGHSLGGGIAMQFAYQYPECCERLVLVDSGGLGREVSWLLRAFTLPGTEFLMPVLVPSFAVEAGTRVEQLCHRLGIRSDRISESWHVYASLSDPIRRATFLRTARAVIDPGGQSVSAIDRLYLTTEIPTLIIWGDQDHIIPVSHAYSAQQAMPGSQVSIVEGAGHFPHAEAPAVFIRLIHEFIAGTSPAALAPERLAEMMRAEVVVA